MMRVELDDLSWSLFFCYIQQLALRIWEHPHATRPHITGFTAHLTISKIIDDNGACLLQIGDRAPIIALQSGPIYRHICLVESLHTLPDDES